MRIAGARRVTGIDGKLIDFGREAEVETRSLLNEMLEFVSTEVDELGSEREMAHIERIMREGTGADRQLAVWERTHDMKAVVDQIVAETYEGLNASQKPRSLVKACHTNLEGIDGQGYSVFSRPKIRVTTRPITLTAATIPRTAGTPNLPFRIGRTKTPKVAPSFATPAANPLAVARNCVRNRIGARVNVVALGPAFINRLNRMKPANTSGMCQLEFDR